MFISTCCMLCRPGLVGVIVVDRPKANHGYGRCMKKIMSIQPPEGCHKYKKLSQNVPGNIAKKFAVYPEV